jgi:hypothetical protein
LGFAQLEHHERSPAEHGVQTDNPLHAEPVMRLRGGGGDGGATGAESRDSYLSMYAEKKPDKVDAGEEKLASFTQCRFFSFSYPALYSASVPTLPWVHPPPTPALSNGRTQRTEAQHSMDTMRTDGLLAHRAPRAQADA